MWSSAVPAHAVENATGNQAAGSGRALAGERGVHAGILVEDQQVDLVDVWNHDRVEHRIAVILNGQLQRPMLRRPDGLYRPEYAEPVKLHLQVLHGHKGFAAGAVAPVA